jgi:sodium-independent sulfate anion transporter 11
VVTLLTAQTVASYSQTVHEMGIVAFCCSVAFFAGLIELFIGFFHLGILVEFISGPTIVGFTCGAAISTQIQQLPSLLGIYNLDNNLAAYIVLYNTLINLPKAHLDAFIGIGALLMLRLWRFMCERLVKNGRSWGVFLGNAGNVVTLITFTTIAIIFNSSYPGSIKVFGEIPSGLKYIAVPSMSQLSVIVPASFTIVIVAILEHIAITKSFGRLNGYKIDPNQEIIALGFTNSIGSFVGAFPTTGSFSRSAVKSRSGVATPLAGLVTGSIVVFAIYFLTGIFAKIPNASLAAVICFNLIDLYSKPKYIKQLWKTDKIDLLVFLTSIIVQFFSNIQTGIFASAALALLVLLFNLARPKVDVLVQDAKGLWVERREGESSSLLQSPPPGILIVSLNDRLVFTNAGYSTSQIYKLASRNTAKKEVQGDGKKELWCEGAGKENTAVANLWGTSDDKKPVLRGIIIDMHSVSQMDTTGLQNLIDLKRNLSRYAGVRVDFTFVGVCRNVERYINSFYEEFEINSSVTLNCNTIDQALSGIQKTVFGLDP